MGTLTTQLVSFVASFSVTFCHVAGSSDGVDCNTYPVNEFGHEMLMLLPKLAISRSGTCAGANANAVNLTPPPNNSSFQLAPPLVVTPKLGELKSFPAT